MRRTVTYLFSAVQRHGAAVESFPLRVVDVCEVVEHVVHVHGSQIVSAVARRATFGTSHAVLALSHKNAEIVVLERAHSLLAAGEAAYLLAVDGDVLLVTRMVGALPPSDGQHAVGVAPAPVAHKVTFKIHVVLRSSHVNNG
ncbi:MAG: hypothetical protein CME58_12545 [Halieaceae bacterium]|nr:hypothetical protein [Halieaceae bacterium]